MHPQAHLADSGGLPSRTNLHHESEKPEAEAA